MQAVAVSVVVVAQAVGIEVRAVAPAVRCVFGKDVEAIVTERVAAGFRASFGTVAHAVYVGVHDTVAREVCVDVGTRFAREATRVSRVERVEALELPLEAVSEPVVVSVLEQGIGAEVALEEIGQSIAIGVDERLAAARRMVAVLVDEVLGRESGLSLGKGVGVRIRVAVIVGIRRATIERSVGLRVETQRGSPLYPGIEERVVDMIHKRSAAARTVVSSFDHAALYSVRSLDEKIRLGYLLGLTTLQTAFREMKDIDAESLNLSVRQTLARTVKAAHDRGRKILVYTVNTPAERDRLNKLGVDGIFSNYPELNLWR